MKLILGSFAVAAFIPLTCASGAVLTLGGPLSKLCYEAALGADSRNSALEACTRAIDEESLPPADKAATYINRGIVLMNGNRYSEADADFDTALTLRGNLPDGWLNKGLLKLRQGDGRAALPLIEKAMANGAANQPLAVFARAVAYEQVGNLEYAYADLERAHQLAPKWSLPRDYLSTYHVKPR